MSSCKTNTMVTSRNNDSRDGLPVEFRSLKRSVPVDPERFEDILDVKVIAEISLSLKNKELSEILNSIGKATGCHPSKVILIDKSRWDPESNRNDSLRYWFSYNKRMNNRIQWTDNFNFNKKYKYWIVKKDQTSNYIMEESLYENFGVVVDVASGVVFKSLKNNSFLDTSPTAFKNFGFYKKVEIQDILTALIKARPQDVINPDDLYLCDEIEFSRLTKSESLFTCSPFLLMRYAVSNGQPRYVIYSTLANQPESYAFGRSKKTSIFIAKYKGSLSKFTMPIFKTDSSPVAPPDAHRTIFRSEFHKFEHGIRRLESFFSDITIAPVMSDYFNASDEMYNGESFDNGLAAYSLRDGNSSYAREISKSLGYQDKDYKIYFSRSAIDYWDPEDLDFEIATIHELARQIAYEDGGSDNPMRLEQYAITNDIIYHVLDEDRWYVATELQFYNGFNTKHLRCLEYCVKEVGIPYVLEILETRKLTKNDISEATRITMVKLENEYPDRQYLGADYHHHRSER